MNMRQLLRAQETCWQAGWAKGGRSRSRARLVQEPAVGKHPEVQQQQRVHHVAIVEQVVVVAAAGAHSRALIS
jgi:hypothetical protein